jgi:hypothetical protein
MSVTVIEATRSTPEVEMDSEGRFIIRGRSVIENTSVFYNPIIEWLKKAECEKMAVEVKLEYLNTSSAKQLLSLLKVVAGNAFFKTISIKWFYEENDEDMLDMGKDYESLIHLPFEFYEFSGV